MATKKPAATDETDRDALELRKAGASTDRIAEALDDLTDAAAAAESVQRALRGIKGEDPEDAHRLELARLDAMQRALWPKARQGDVQAVDRCLAIMDRRARLLGIEPRKEQPEGDRIDELEEKRNRRRAGVAKTPRARGS